MVNPYKILGISQNASKAEIIKATVQAMRVKNFSLQQIHEAQHILLSPTKRLVADFLFPSKIKAKRPKIITMEFEEKKVDIDNLDKNAINSLM